MHIIRTVAIPLFLSLLFIGCTRGCSEKQGDGTAGSAVQPASKPTATFRITPAGAECVSGRPCGNNDMQRLVELSRDLAAPIDWTRETDVWQENHDFEANLGKAQEQNSLAARCDTPQIMSLYRTRQRLFHILRKLTEEDSRWKDAAWFHNRPYYELLYSRDTARFSPLFQELNSVQAKLGIDDQRLASDWRLFASELLRYHTMVLSVPDWQTKFSQLEQSGGNLTSGSHFHDAGFPKTDDACHHLPWIFGGNYIVGYDQGLEGWFYSFWVRRHKEGTREVVKDLLEWGVAAVPASAENTAAFVSSMTVPSSPGEGQH